MAGLAYRKASAQEPDIAWEHRSSGNVAGWASPKSVQRACVCRCVSHWTPESFAKALGELGLRAGSGNPDPLMVDMDKRRKWMDEHGVETLILTLSGGMPWQWVSPETGGHLAELVNGDSRH